MRASWRRDLVRESTQRCTHRISQQLSARTDVGDIVSRGTIGIVVRELRGIGLLLSADAIEQVAEGRARRPGHRACRPGSLVTLLLGACPDYRSLRV